MVEMLCGIYQRQDSVEHDLPKGGRGNHLPVKLTPVGLIGEDQTLNSKGAWHQ